MIYSLHEIAQAYGRGEFCDKLPDLAAVECHLHQIDVRHATVWWFPVGYLALALAISAALSGPFGRWLFRR